MQIPSSHHFSTLRVVPVVLLLWECFLPIESALLSSRYIHIRCCWKQQGGTTAVWAPIADIILVTIVLRGFGIYALLTLRKQACLTPCVCAQAFISASLFRLALNICSLQPIEVLDFIRAVRQSAIWPILQVSGRRLRFLLRRKVELTILSEYSSVYFLWVASNCDKGEWIRTELSMLRDVDAVLLRRFLPRQSITWIGLLSAKKVSVQNGDVKVLTSLRRPD